MDLTCSIVSAVSRGLGASRHGSRAAAGVHEGEGVRRRDRTRSARDQLESPQYWEGDRGKSSGQRTAAIAAKAAAAHFQLRVILETEEGTSARWACYLLWTTRTVTRKTPLA